MGMNRWLQRQDRRRLFFILWSIYFVMYAAVQIGTSISVAAYHAGRPFHPPPLWTYPLDALTSAVLAALVIPIMRRKQMRHARKAQADHQA